MLKELRNAVQKVAFQPFWIELSSGSEISVPYPDHILVGRAGAAVEDDEGTIHVLSPLHIARISSKPRETPA